MFDILLGRNFTAKCKHAIKCIYERLKPIRNRKQSVVNILRQDIADLLRRGNAEHAFGRMDELINDMNRLDCYNMIEKFCKEVIIQLPVLQKLREFPPQNRQAMSTLIFAAARFSDLPELCELREAFRARYGDDLEMSVNPEFKEKSASRAFSAFRKLQFMKNIASELSIEWNSKAFESHITRPIASKCDQRKKRDALEVEDPKVLPSEKEGMRRYLFTNAEDIHTINVEPEAEPITKFNSWTEEPGFMIASTIEPSNCSVKLGKDKPRSMNKQRDRNKVPSSSQADDDEELSGFCGNNINRMSSAQLKPKPYGEKGNAASSSYALPLAQQKSGSAVAKELHVDVYKRPSGYKTDHMEERRRTIGQQEFEKHDKPIEVSLFAQQNIKHTPGPSSCNEYLLKEKSRKGRQEATIQDGYIFDTLKPKNTGSYYMLPPPYVKSPVTKVGATREQFMPSSLPADERSSAICEISPYRQIPLDMSAASDKLNNCKYKDLHTNELVADDGRSKPRSIGRKPQRPPVALEADYVVHDGEPFPQISRCQQRRSRREDTVVAQVGYDEEEKAMDKLLLHYSKKGLLDQPRNH